MKPLIIILCMLAGLGATAEAAARKDSVAAVYHFVNEAQSETIIMHLCKNKTYDNGVHGDHYDYYSKGTWKKREERSR